MKMIDLPDDKTQQKQCRKCGREFPRTNQYWKYKEQGRDGFEARCRECMGEKFKLDPAADGYKRCRRCKQEFAANTQNFYVARQSRDGLGSYCKGCEAELRKRELKPKPILPEGFIICGSCKKLLPACFGHFYRNSSNKTGFTSECKNCVAIRQGSTRHVLSILPDGKKRCTKCGFISSNPKEDFWADSSKTDGLSTRCKECQRTQGQEYRSRETVIIAQREHSRNYYIENRAAILAYQEFYRSTHRVELRQKALVYYNKTKNTPKRKEYNRAYHRVYNQREYVKRNGRIRRQLRKTAEGTFTIQDVRAIYDSQNGLCWWCGQFVGTSYHIDHRIPLARGGTNFPNNLCISCVKCNLSKGAKMPWEWNGRLL